MKNQLRVSVGMLVEEAKVCARESGRGGAAGEFSDGGEGDEIVADSVGRKMEEVELVIVLMRVTAIVDAQDSKEQNDNNDESRGKEEISKIRLQNLMKLAPFNDAGLFDANVMTGLRAFEMSVVATEVATRADSARPSLPHNQVIVDRFSIVLVAFNRFACDWAYDKGIKSELFSKEVNRSGPYVL
ncbi:hypothetical protein Tco_0461821 [Tanacetum coccineum]